MKKKHPFCFLFILILIISCKKSTNDSISDTQQLEEIISGYSSEHNKEIDQVYNFILIRNSQSINPLDTLPNNFITASATFTDSSQFVSAGSLIVGNRSIEINSNQNYDFEYTTSNLNEGLNLIGNDVNISLTGSSFYSARTRSVYVPANIITSTLYYNFSTVSRSSNLILNWKPDNQNLNGKAYIQISLYKGLTLLNNPNWTSNNLSNIEPLRYTVNDNGYFSIPVNDLQIFPMNSYIGVSIARGVQYVDESSYAKKRVYYFTISDFKTAPLLVVQ